MQAWHLLAALGHRDIFFRPGANLCFTLLWPAALAASLRWSWRAPRSYAAWREVCLLRLAGPRRTGVGGLRLLCMLPCQQRPAQWHTHTRRSASAPREPGLDPLRVVHCVPCTGAHHPPPAGRLPHICHLGDGIPDPGRRQRVAGGASGGRGALLGCGAVRLDGRQPTGGRPGVAQALLGPLPLPGALRWVGGQG